MRFVENGPSIPDELLNARDEGRVVFFCGAGVSRCAGLPDFFGLAESVLRELGASGDSDAYKVLTEARDIGNRLQVTGLISADRVFGLLERDFTVKDIQAAVAKSLKPPERTDISAHRILLRLGTTPDSKLQLVTTNFDRLFEQCGRDLPAFQPPRLPNPSRYNDLNGVVYLHGRITSDYSEAECDGLILSSSDFGYAYLSEGWATEFFREIVKSYLVVFIGYSADDPPISYMLEGLRKLQDPSRRIYAFQAKESEEAVGRWVHKEVKPISYSPLDGHKALWNTLELWAERADNPDLWLRRVVEGAMNGPECLAPHQRGQVAHVVSFYTSARQFVERTPPAEWLCTFDPKCRYATPEQPHEFAPDKTVVDPFDLYGLDSDSAPEAVDSSNPYFERTIPEKAWDAFALNNSDREDLSEQSFSTLRGHYALHSPRLPNRMHFLGIWISKVVNQPATLWWAIGQEALHPTVRQLIAWELVRLRNQIAPSMLTAWQYLLESRKYSKERTSPVWHDLKTKADQEGWDPGVARQFIETTRPYLKAKLPIFRNVSLPPKDDQLDIHELIHLEVEFPVPRSDVQVPDEWIFFVANGLRNNLEFGIQMCKEVHDPSPYSLDTIARDQRAGLERRYGLSAYVNSYLNVFDTLVELNISRARKELLSWPDDDEFVFTKLRIYAAENSALCPPNEVGQIFDSLPSNVFWDRAHQSELLLTLTTRWQDLSVECRKQIEDRILTGPEQWEEEPEDSYDERKARRILDRLQWLDNKDCDFSFDVKAKITELQKQDPTWKKEKALHARDFLGIRCGNVTTNTEHDRLLDTPIDSILQKSRELTGRSPQNFLEETDPFAGLCRDRPVRAYLALAHAARRKEYPDWAWRKFLNSSTSERDESRFLAVIAERVSRIPNEESAEMLFASTSWLSKMAASLSKEHASIFDKLVDRLIEVISLHPANAESGVLGASTIRRWAMASLNSPAGHIVAAIVEDRRLQRAHDATAHESNALTQLQKLLNLDGDPRRHAITMISHNLAWFYSIVPRWTEQNLLSVLDADDEEDGQALWAGFLWNPQLQGEELFLRLKSSLLEFAKEKISTHHGHIQSLAYLVYKGWAELGHSGEKLVLDNEFHDVLLHAGSEFRSHVIWQIERELDDCEGVEDRSQVEKSLIDLFNNVWPRQKIVKDSDTSLKLCNLLFTSGEIFGRIVNAILPHLTSVERADEFFLLKDMHEGIIDDSPERFLAVLDLTLTDKVVYWPHNFGDVLERLVRADKSLVSDQRYQILKRRWDAR